MYGNIRRISLEIGTDVYTGIGDLIGVDPWVSALSLDTQSRDTVGHLIQNKHPHDRESTAGPKR
jgi:hypothetical protein